MYTLLHTQALEDTMMSEYYEHCYSEQVLIKGRCAITCIPDSVSQLIMGYQFEPLAEFSTKEEAESARERYIEYGSIQVEEAPPIVEDPLPPVVEEVSMLPEIPRIKLQKIIKEQIEGDSNMQVPWFGNNLKVIREKKENVNDK